MDQFIKNVIEDKLYEIARRFNLNIDIEDMKKVVYLSYHDLNSFSLKDPSSNKDMLYVLETYVSYYAVLIYRIAHLCYENNKMIARQLSEYAKLKTGIEIHPGATIGKNFVLDHGVGTVIGETTIIGDNCYILQSVVLGSTQIGNNVNASRHPIIGNNVEIGGFVRIYGPIRIGDNVKISPGAIIKKPIPDNSKIIVSSNYQVVKGSLKIYFTGYYLTGNRVTLFFKGFNMLRFNIVNVYLSNELVSDVHISYSALEFTGNMEELSDIHIIFDETSELNLSLN